MSSIAIRPYNIQYICFIYILLGSPPLPPVLYIVKMPTTEIMIVSPKITQSKFEIIWYFKMPLLFIFITGALVTFYIALYQFSSNRGSSRAAMTAMLHQNCYSNHRIFIRCKGSKPCVVSKFIRNFLIIFFFYFRHPDYLCCPCLSRHLYPFNAGSPSGTPWVAYNPMKSILYYIKRFLS